jgi:hypothetical protein
MARIVVNLRAAGGMVVAWMNGMTSSWLAAVQRG